MVCKADRPTVIYTNGEREKKTHTHTQNSPIHYTLKVAYEI